MIAAQIENPNSLLLYHSGRADYTSCSNKEKMQRVFLRTIMFLSLARVIGILICVGYNGFGLGEGGDFHHKC
jgi:hypothetical protein